MKKDIESRLKNLKKKMGSKPDDELAYTIQHMSAERLATALMACKGVTPGEVDKIKRFAREATINPNSLIADELLDISFVKAYRERMKVES